MVNTCCIEGCQPETGRELTYFKFPKKQVYKQKWLKAIKSGKNSKNITRNSLVCSSHFLDTDYKLVQGKKTLKATVVPSVFGKVHKNHTTQSDLPVRRTRSSKLPLKDSGDEKSASDDDESDTSTGGDKSPVRTEQLDVNEAVQDNGRDNLDDITDNLSDSTKECGKTIDELMACLNGDVEEKPTTANDTKPQQTSSILDSDMSKSIVASKTLTNEAVTQPLTDISMKPIVSNVIENLDYEDLIEQSQVKTNELRRVYIDSVNENRQNDGWYDGSVSKDLMEPEPVFISIPVDPMLASTYSPVESPCADSNPEPVEVQVEVDPALLGYSGAADDDDDDDEDDVQVIERPNEQVSLLTSSDDDDVIIEEPKIDTVEVSDETDEDDLPLTSYLKTKKGLDEFEKNFKEILWGTAKEYYCYSCSYVSQSKSDLRTHIESHTKTSQIMVCPVCDFQSPSKAQFARHKRKHKEERRYKCHLCEYRARHKMSLVYHMKSHSDTDNTAYHKCKLCTYRTEDRLKMHRHLKNNHQVKIFMCDNCNYSTTRICDLKKHSKVRHSVPPVED